MNQSDDQPSANYVTCRCQHCDKGIEFDASDFDEGETRTIKCPHCHLETAAFVPPATEIEHSPGVPPTIAEVQQAELEQYKTQKINQIKTVMRSQLQNGKPIFLYDSIFVPVDSILDDNDLADEFNLSTLRRLGLFGWDVVQAVPKTIGIGLKNVGTDTLFGEKWGGGIGGNVMGVHIIIKKSVSVSEITDDAADEVGEFIRAHLSDFLSE